MKKANSTITAWLHPYRAKVKYSCPKPANWDEMDGDAKLEYFDQHKEYTGTYEMDEEADPDWYDGIDPDVDFKEEK